MKKIIAAILTGIMLVVSTACGPKPPAQTPVSASEPSEPEEEPTEEEEEGWCERNFNTCMIIISISAGIFLGGAVTSITILVMDPP